MKIVEVELINHIVIPSNFHINLRGKTDVICIDGLNGSGKSFLINNIHPLSSNRRSKDRYPIIKGKAGMKRIVYDIGNDCELEIIHEYAINGKRHACKSYCNLLRESGVEELNPTGHTGNFETIVRKYLYFDSDTFVCSFLSPKAESIVTATSTKRKDIFKNTMKSSKILESLVGVNREILSDANTSIKIYNKQMEDAYKSLPYKSLVEFKEAIEDNVNKINTMGSKLETTEKQKEELLKIINQYENMDIVNLPILKGYIDLLDILEMKSMKDAFTEFDDRKKNLGILEYQLAVNSKRIKDIKEEIDSYVDIGFIQTKIKDCENESTSLEAKISGIVKDRNDIFVLLDILGRMKDILGKLPISNIKLGKNDIDTLDEKIILVSNEIKDKREFIQYFNEKLKSSSDTEEKIDINTNDNCNNCQLYIKYVKNNEYIKNNYEKFTTYLESIDELEDILSDLNRVVFTRSELDSIVKRLHDISELKIFRDVKLDDSIELIKDSLYSSSVSETIGELKESIGFNLNRLNKNKDELTELYKEIAKASIIDIIGINKELDILRSNNLILKSDISNDLAFTDIFENAGVSRGTEYDCMEIDELKIKFQNLSNVDSILKDFKTKLNELNMAINYYRDGISSRNSIVAKLQENMKMLENLNSDLIDKKMMSTKHGILKDILEKRIPIKLMETNMDFIENTVNSIMEENEINLTIDILIEENDIRIEVTTRNQTVDDIAMCSSGELCLLGVVLNAVLMHIIGYTIISFDEMDSNLDVVYRESFHNVIYSILERLNIEQVFCVSHNISFDMNVGHIVIGEYDIERLHGEIIEYN